MHGVDAEVPWPNDAHDGVEIRPIAVEERPGIMHGLGDLDHLWLEQATGIGVGQHDRRDVWRKRILDGLHIHGAIVTRRDRLDAVTEEGGGGRIGAMGAFGDQHDLAVALAGGVLRRLDRHHAQQFAMRARLG
jgi:hypothetical protein